MNFSCAFYGFYFQNSSTFLINMKLCALTSLVLSFPTVLMNTSLFIVILMDKDRSKPCNLFLLNLVITDCLCGYIVHPFHAAFFYELSEGRDPCSYALVIFPIVSILNVTTMLAICSVTTERYTAVFYPFFYESKVNLRSTLLVMAATWVVSISFSLHPVFTKELQLFGAFVLLLAIAVASSNFYCYFKILRFTHKIRQELNKTRRRLDIPHCNAKERSLTLTGTFILISMCVSYVPFNLVVCLQLAGASSDAVEYMQCWTWVLLQSTSCLNACITCYQFSHFRRAILRLWTCKWRDSVRVMAVSPSPQQRDRKCAMQAGKAFHLS